MTTTVRLQDKASKAQKLAHDSAVAWGFAKRVDFRTIELLPMTKANKKAVTK